MGRVALGEDVVYHSESGENASKRRL